MKKLLVVISLLLVMTVQALPRLVYVLPIQAEIDAQAWQYTSRACELARQQSADLFVVHMNTFGGEVNYADLIRRELIDMPMPTMAYIDHNAASAGAMIALACDTVYMAPGASMGAVTMVNGAGEPMPDKYQSYGRSILRSTAELHGKNPDGTWRRDPAIAVRMVGPDSVVTFTAMEAVEAHYAEGIQPSLQSAIDALGYQNAKIETFQPTLTDKIIGFLTGTGVRAILVMLILAGIYMEMHTPGLGFAAGVSVVSAILYFLPMIVTGTLAGWIPVLFLIGILLVALEIFVIPGFGVCGISGIVAIVVSLIGAMFSGMAISEITARTVLNVLGSIGAGIVLAFVVGWFLTSRFGPKSIHRKSELQFELSNDQGYVGVDMDSTALVGAEGVAVTDLRPAGRIRIGEQDYEAASTGAFIEADTPVKVVRYQGATLYVTERTENR